MMEMITYISEMINLGNGFKKINLKGHALKVFYAIL